MKGPLTGEGTRVEGGDEVRVKAVDTDEEELEGVSTASSCLHDTLKVTSLPAPVARLLPDDCLLFNGCLMPDDCLLLGCKLLG